MIDVFISHAQDDKRIARQLAHDLRVAGLSVWMDEEDLRPGERWASAVSGAIDASNNVLILLSDTSSKSNWVRSEIALALSQKDKRVIPVLLSRNVEIPLLLRTRQALDLSNERSYSKSLPILLDVLRVPESDEEQVEEKARYRIAELEHERLNLDREQLSIMHIVINRRIISSTVAIAIVTAGIALGSFYLLEVGIDRVGVFLGGAFVGVAASIMISILSRTISKLISEEKGVDRRRRTSE